MKCIVHPELPAAGTCVGCGNFHCDACLTSVGRKKYCSECVTELLADKDRALDRERDRGDRAERGGPTNIVVTATGGGASSSSSSSAAANAGGGGYYPRAPGASKTVCLLLAIFLPCGIHRLLMGHTTTGLVQMALSFFCLVGVLWGWIDALQIMGGSLRMADGRPLS